MDKEEFNQSIDDIPVSVESLMQREKMAMFQAKKKIKHRNVGKYSGLIASVLCISLLGTGFVSPTFAQTLSKIPYIGPIYSQFHDMAAGKIEQEELATMIERQDEHNGITMAVKEAVYDGGRLIVTVEYKGKGTHLDLGDEAKIGNRYITINGEEPHVATGTVTSDSINANNVVESHQFTITNYDEYGDTINVAVHGENLFGEKGKWNVSFPLEKLDENTRKFTSNVQVQTEDDLFTLKVKQVIFSSLSTRIDLNLDYPIEMDENDTWPWFNYVVTDDDGNVFKDLKLQSGQIGKNGHGIVLVIPPFENVPKFLTVQPFFNEAPNGILKNDEIHELKVKIPIK